MKVFIISPDLVEKYMRADQAQLIQVMIGIIKAKGRTILLLNNPDPFLEIYDKLRRDLDKLDKSVLKGLPILVGMHCLPKADKGVSPADIKEIRELLKIKPNKIVLASSRKEDFSLVRSSGISFVHIFGNQLIKTQTKYEARRELRGLLGFM